MITNMRPEQHSEINWPWVNQTTRDGYRFVVKSPGKVFMPDLIGPFNWNRFKFDVWSRDHLRSNNFLATVDMKSIFTTYTRFVGMEQALMDFDEDEMDLVWEGFDRWNRKLLEATPFKIQVFVLGDDLCGARGPLISPNKIADHYIQFPLRMFDMARGEGNVEACVFHCCGDIYKLLDVLATLPIQAIHFQKVGQMEKFNDGDFILGNDKRVIELWENKNPFRNKER